MLYTQVHGDGDPRYRTIGHPRADSGSNARVIIRTVRFTVTITRSVIARARPPGLRTSSLRA